MELVNETECSTLLFRTSLGGDNFAAAVIARKTFRINGEELIPTGQPFFPLSAQPRMTEFGPTESDLVYRRGGVDLLIFGKAMALNGIPVSRMKVKIKRGGKLQHEIAVYGDRFWRKKDAELVISPPQQFKEMSLGLVNAYGGMTEWDGLEIPHAENPYGKGFYQSREEAEGKPLANLENAKKPVQSWSDHPEPVSPAQCPMNTLRMKNNVEFEGMKMIKLDAKFYNSAFPNMILDEVKIGEKIEIEGVTENGRLGFFIPKNNLSISLKIGKREHERELLHDQILIFPSQRIVEITYRFPFRYLFKPLEIRECRLTEKK